MDKHTFKVGDRVVCLKAAYSNMAGEKGQYWEGTQRGCQFYGIKFDALAKEHREGFFSFGSLGYREAHRYMKHDTDFQVGDWVRYEKTKDEGTWGDICFSDKTQVFKITALHSSLHCEIVGTYGVGGTLCQSCYLDNLVKIQLPQKDSDDTIIRVFTSYTNKEEKNMRNVFSITHEKYGVVQGVHLVAPGCYCKNGAYYYHGEGWRETEEWVKIEVRKSQWDKIYKDDGVIVSYGINIDRSMVRWRYPQ